MVAASGRKEKRFYWLMALAAGLISWAYQLFWQQIFHPGQSFFLTFLFLFPLIILLNEGFSRLTSLQSGLALAQIRPRHALCVFAFLPLIIPCLKGEFSRELAVICCVLYFLSTGVIFLVSGRRKGSLRSPIFDLGAILILLGLILTVYYKFLVLEYIFFPCDAGYVYYGSNLFLGRSITQGIFPLWNPYYHLGIPIYAVPEGQAFFPVYLIAAMLSPTYGFYHYALLCFALPQFLGAVGFYLFIRFMIRRRLIALTTATAYALSGFTVYPSSVTYAYSMACLPWIVFFAVKAFTIRRFPAGCCVGAAVAVALAIVTCYPILWYAYILHLFVLALIVIIFGIRCRNRLGPVVLRLTLILVLSGVLAAPYLISMSKYLPLTGRGDDLEYSWAVGYNNLTPRNIFTLWFPSTSQFSPTDEARACTGLDELYRFDMMNFNAQTDTYRSIYLTIPCFFFALVALVRWRKYRGLSLVFGFLALGYLFMSMGGHGFLYEKFYYFVPLFAKARQSSVHRIFFIFYFLVLSALGMRLIFRPVRDRLVDWFTRLPLVIFLVILFGLGATLLLLIIPPLADADDTTLYSYLFHDIVYGLIFGGATLVFFLGRQNRSRFLGIGIFILVAADALTFTYSNHRSYTYCHAHYADSLSPFTKDFSVVDNHRHRPAWNDAEWVHSFDFTVGTHALNRPQLPGYQWHRSEKLAPYAESLFKLYSEVVCCPPQQMLVAMEASRGQSAFLPEGTKFPSWFTPEEREKRGTTGKLKIEWYAPNEAQVQVETEEGGLLVMGDMYYPGWKVLIDRQEARLLQANFNCKGVFVPPGIHRVHFVFDPSDFRLGLFISAFGLWCCVFLISGRFRSFAGSPPDQQESLDSQL